jgi:signal peptidase
MEISTTDRGPGRAWRVLINVASVVVMVLAMVFIVPAAFGYERYVITGSSMNGSLDLGSVAFARVVPVGELEVGDVITYLPPPESGVDSLVTHRIVRIDGAVLRTKGDANPSPDPWTFELHQGTQARVEHSVPYLGWVFITLHDRTTRMALIGVPAALIALASLGQLGAALRRADEQRPGSHVVVGR